MLESCAVVLQHIHKEKGGDSANFEMVNAYNNVIRQGVKLPPQIYVVAVERCALHALEEELVLL